MHGPKPCTIKVESALRYTREALRTHYGLPVMTEGTEQALSCCKAVQTTQLLMSADENFDRENEVVCSHSGNY